MAAPGFICLNAIHQEHTRVSRIEPKLLDGARPRLLGYGFLLPSLFPTARVAKRNGSRGPFWTDWPDTHPFCRSNGTGSARERKMVSVGAAPSMSPRRRRSRAARSKAWPTRYASSRSRRCDRWPSPPPDSSRYTGQGRSELHSSANLSMSSARHRYSTAARGCATSTVENRAILTRCRITRSADIVPGRRAGRILERGPAISQQGIGIDALIDRSIRLEFPNRFPHLADGAHAVVAPEVVIRDRKVNDRLQEQFARARLATSTRLREPRDTRSTRAR